MTRTNAREIAIQLGFAASASGISPLDMMDAFFSPEHYETLATEDELFSQLPDEKQLTYIRQLNTLLFDNLSEIDGYIERYSRGWKIERISRTARAVLRCAVCEILYMEDIPPSASINEAVELAKGYDEPETVSFVNGVLGGFMRSEFPEAGAVTEE